MVPLILGSDVQSLFLQRYIVVLVKEKEKCYLGTWGSWVGKKDPILPRQSRTSLPSMRKDYLIKEQTRPVTIYHPITRRPYILLSLSPAPSLRPNSAAWGPPHASSFIHRRMWRHKRGANEQIGEEESEFKAFKFCNLDHACDGLGLGRFGGRPRRLHHTFGQEYRGKIVSAMAN